MPIALEGGCLVAGLKEGTPLERGGTRVWQRFRSRLSLDVIEIDGEAKFGSETRDEVLYNLATDTGVYIPAGQTMTLRGSGTLVSAFTDAEPRQRHPVTARLEDQPVQQTGDRWYRELIQGEVTQFVGSIPPGRAPDHFHLYEEVICILQGEGLMWAGESSTPVGPGSCIFLPVRQRHCLQNLGSGELRLLGVFYPAGSPAVRYPA
jgi:mannose-6-phosphate isomerase-like protein (cupin superfamily)